MTEEQLVKLPKWAREEFRTIRLERDAAVKKLNKYVDDQTVSAFEIRDLVSTGEQQGPSMKIQYIQTHRVHVQCGLMELDVSENSYAQHRGGCSGNPFGLVQFGSGL